MSRSQKCHVADNFVQNLMIGALKWLVCFVILIPHFTEARQPTEAEFTAATLTSEEVAIFFEKLDRKASSVAIYDVKVNHPLDPGFSEVLEGEVVRALKANRAISLVSCPECRSARLEVRNDKLVIRKGLTDHQVMRDLSKELGVDSFVSLEVFRTKYTVVTQVTLYQASDGDIIGSTQIKVPCLDWTDAGLLVLFSVGPAIVGGGNEVGSTSSKFHVGGNVGVLEEIGFGKAGLVLGGVGGSKGGMGYIIPTLAWRGRFGSYGLYSLKSFGAGFGYSDDTGGIAVRGGYNLMLGTFTSVGVEVSGLVPVQKAADKRPLTFAAAFTIGFAFGR